MVKLLDFLFFLAYCNILLTRYLLKQIHRTNIQFNLIDIKALEITTTMLFHLVFAKNTIFIFCFVFLNY